MAKISYKYEDKTQLTKHFNVQEWKCKCGKKHEIIIDDKLPVLLENLMAKVGAKHGNIYSGYRCPSHNKKVGSSGTTNYSHSGYAVDIYFTDEKGKRIPSKTICLALEDMGHKNGIGYRCGGSSNASGQIHIDVKPRKWYGDESKSMSKSCCSSFYDYFGIKKADAKYIRLKASVWCRKGIGFTYPKYKCIPVLTKCELIKKNVRKANGYNWDKVKFKKEIVYLPNKWNKYL